MSVVESPALGINAASEARRLVARSHGVRTLALVLGGIAVAGVFYQRGAPAPMWGLLALYVLIWPHAAWLMVRRSTNPVVTSRRQFLGDAAITGIWIAQMGFNLLPSVLLATMTAMTLVATEGGRLLLIGIAWQALVCGVAAVATGFAFAPNTSTFEMLMSMPLLTLFPVALGFITHRLAQQVRSQNHELLELSSVDSLSGLLNRGHWEAVVNTLLKGRRREEGVMLMIDIDRFKQVNDRYGHTVGDDVIRTVGAVIRDGVREGDLAGRYGGDEFAVVLRDADLHVATQVAERIRTGLASTMDKAGLLHLHCTLSIGAAACGAEMRDARQWVASADAALYRAKSAGRNQYVEKQ